MSGLVSAVAAPLRVNRPGETGLADEESHLVGKTLLGSDVYPTLDATAYEKGWCNQSMSQGLGVYCRSSGQTNAETHYELSPTLNCNRDLAPIVSVAHTLRAGWSNSEDGTGRGTPIVPVAFAPEVHPTMVARSSRGGGQSNLPGHNADETLVGTGWHVRRLTPTECERLQGFPDGYTDIPWRGKPTSPDGPRYKALGNSMACNVMRWIGQRIQMVDAMEIVDV